MTTKSGGNAFHGSVFEFLRNDAFDSKNFFAVNKEKLERNQFGGTLGGPVVIPGMYDGRNKTFFFASYEGHRRQQGIVDVSIVPSAAQRQGDFSGLAPIFDPLTTTTVGGVATRTQFANNQHSGESHLAAGAVLHCGTSRCRMRRATRTCRTRSRSSMRIR